MGSASRAVVLRRTQLSDDPRRARQVSAEPFAICGRDLRKHVETAKSSDLNLDKNLQQPAKTCNFLLPNEEQRGTQSLLTVAGLLQQDSAGPELQCSWNRI
jgi:hypothetical protein